MFKSRDILDTENQSMAMENLRTFTHMLCVLGISMIFITVILSAVLNLGDVISSIPLTIGLTFISVAVVGYIFERRGWLSIITDRITNLMLNPEFLAKMGMSSSKLRKNVLGLLKGGLSIEDLHPDFFNSIDRVLIGRLIEPVTENLVLDLHIKLVKEGDREYVKVNFYRCYNVVNPTTEKQKLFTDNVVDRVWYTMPKAFKDIQKDEYGKLYKMLAFRIDETDLEDLTCDVSTQEGKYYSACKNSDEEIDSGDRKFIELQTTFVADTSDGFLYGLKTITRNVSCHVHYNSEELKVECVMTSPLPYPVVYTPIELSNGEEMVQTREVLYPGNSIIVIWKPI